MRQRQGDPREDGEKRLSRAVAGLPCARAHRADAKEREGVEAGQPRQASARIRPIRYRVGRAVPSPSQNLRRGLRHPLDATPSQAILGEACDKGVSTAVTALQHASFARRPPSSKKAPSRSERGEAENPLGAKPASHPLRPPAFDAAIQQARTPAAIRRRPPKTARSNACTAQRGSAQTADHAQDGPHSSATCR